MPIRLAFISLTLFLCSTGCVHEERFVRTVRVPSPASQEMLNQFFAQHPELPSEHRTALAENSITIGMSREAVEALCGDQIAKYSGDLWVLKQKVSVTPGIYPYFDCRAARLYWIDERLAAIILRREYNVYP